MSLFNAIMNKIFHHEAIQPSPSPQTSEPSPSVAGPSSATAAPVDVEAVLSVMADDKNGGGNWHASIVDLLKLLDLDSSLAARQELADELGVHVGVNGSAEENIALHKAVMQKLADNGGLVPDSLRQ